jgi:hypothetical protein
VARPFLLAAPVAAPAYEEGLRSDDPEEREAAMLELRRQRRARAMESVIRRRTAERVAPP